jgi:hypothetical protein
VWYRARHNTPPPPGLLHTPPCTPRPQTEPRTVNCWDRQIAYIVTDNCMYCQHPAFSQNTAKPTTLGVTQHTTADDHTTPKLPTTAACSRMKINTALVCAQPPLHATSCSANQLHLHPKRTQTAEPLQPCMLLWHHTAVPSSVYCTP